jgi:hypothetical protein
MKKVVAILGVSLLTALAVAQTAISPNPQYTAFKVGQTWNLGIGELQKLGQITLTKAVTGTPFLHPARIFSSIKTWDAIEGEIQMGSTKGLVRLGNPEKGMTALYASVAGRQYHCVFLMPSRGASIRGGGFVFQDGTNTPVAAKDQCTLSIVSDPMQIMRATTKPEFSGAEWFSKVLPDANTVWRLEAFNYRFDLWFDKLQPNGFTGDADLIRSPDESFFNDWTFRLFTIGPTAKLEMMNATYQMQCELSLGEFRNNTIFTDGSYGVKGSGESKDGPCRVLVTRQ